MTPPSVSVIICTWNRCELLSEMLETLRWQRLPTQHEIEILVVDNNSSDQTACMVQDMAASWPLGTLRYLREGKQGKQFALNLALRSAVGDILAFTDDDVLLPNDWVANILELFSDPKVELAGGKTLLLWPDGSAPTWFRPSMLAVVAGVDLGNERLRSPPAEYAPAGTNLIARRSLFDRIGFFSEMHYRHMDYEFGIRAQRSGAVIEYDPALVVRTRVPEDILNKRYLRRWYFKLGIASTIHPIVPSRNTLGVPRWIWRQITADGVVVCLYALRGHGNDVVEREIRLAQLLGYVSSVWHKKLWPGTHQRWVERWSQKCGAKFR